MPDLASEVGDLFFCRFCVSLDEAEDNSRARLRDGDGSMILLQTCSPPSLIVIETAHFRKRVAGCVILRHSLGSAYNEKV